MKQHKSLRIISRLIAITTVFVMPITPVVADELDDLKAQLEVLSRKVEELEYLRDQELNEKRANPPIKDVVTRGDVSGSYKLPGSDTSVRVGGYVKADLIYDIDARPLSRGGDIASTHEAILEDDPQYQNTGDTRVGVRDSRFNIETFTPTDYGQLHTYLQGDFAGPPNDKPSRATNSRYGFGLRHAYGELGDFLAGQYWTNFMDNSALPDKLDATGPTGRTFIRQGQFRYTHHFQKGEELAFALENPKGDFNGANDDTLNDSLPDLTARYRYEGDDWHMQFAGLLRRMGNYDETTDSNIDSVTGWGLSQSGSFFLPTQKDRFTWYLVFGDGAGRYIEGGTDQGASVEANGELDTQFGYGGFITYKHLWSETLASNIDFGAGRYKLNAGEIADASKRLYSSHINTIWSPIEKIEIGLEYVWGWRQVKDGREGKINRLQFSTLYNF